MKALDPIIHAQLRLAIMSVLTSVNKTDFNYLKEVTEASSGNLSVQINKLKEAGYVKVTKTFKNNYPLTECAITKKGSSAFETYCENLKSYFTKKNKNL